MLHLPEDDGTLTRLVRSVFAADESSESSWDTALLPGAVVGRFELVRRVPAPGIRPGQAFRIKWGATKHLE